MKKLIIVGAITAGLSIPQMAPAQSIVYLSNLDQPSAGSLSVGSDLWYAATFITGPNTGGYLLDSVQLEMADASGSPSGFTVMLYAQSSLLGGIFPGNSLGTLNGSANPSTTGIYTYTPASNLTLSPNTDYFIVLTAGTTVANGAYEWSDQNTGSYNPVDNWHTVVPLWSSNGSSWHAPGPPFDSLQYAITATAIPEPSPSWLLLIGSGIFIYIRARNHISTRAKSN